MENAIRPAVYPSLEDRTVVVTGGASGIGEAIVEAFAAQGAQVVFLDVQDDASERLIRRSRVGGTEGTGLLPLRSDGYRCAAKDGWRFACEISASRRSGEQCGE